MDHTHLPLGNHGILFITHADVIDKIYDEYLVAGSDFCETSSFSCSKIAHADYGLNNEKDILDINFDSAQLCPRRERHAPLHRSSRPLLRRLYYLLPNAGLPNAMGGYDQNGPKMAEEMREFVEGRLCNIICVFCVAVPEHIASLVGMVN